MRGFKSKNNSLYVKPFEDDYKLYVTLDGYNYAEDTFDFWEDDFDDFLVEEYDGPEAVSAAITKLQENSLNLLERAKNLSAELHKGQTDLAGKDYFTAHINTVVGSVGGLNESVYYIITAYLHDVLEDTDITADELYEEFPREIVDAVVCLTKNKNESYEDYINRVKKNPMAKTVKICDLANNMDLSRLNSVTEKDLERLSKYSKAFALLMK